MLRVADIKALLGIPVRDPELSVAMAEEFRGKLRQMRRSLRAAERGSPKSEKREQGASLGLRLPKFIGALVRVINQGAIVAMERGISIVRSISHGDALDQRLGVVACRRIPLFQH